MEKEGTWRPEQPAATGLETESPQASFNRAVDLHKRGQLDEAEILYRQVLFREPRHGDALHLLGVAAFQRGNPAAAVPLFAAALAIIPGNAVAHIGHARALSILGRQQEALASAGRALAIQPGNVEALNCRCAVLIALGRPAEALAGCERALAIRPGDAEALNNRGVALDQLGRLPESLASYDQALAIWPDYLEALNNRASVLIGLKRPEEALASCDRALAIRPDAAQVLNNRGIALRNLDRRQEAVVSFQQALVAQPGTPDFHTNLGVTYRELGQLELAEASLREALPARMPETFQSLATVLYQQGRVAEATGTYEQWLAHDPDNPIARHMTAAGRGTAPERATDEYVAELFDGFADSFDNTLAQLDYRAPQLLVDLLKQVDGERLRGARILDAGCGTGLCGPLLRPMAARLVGVDLSSGMIDKARGRQQYDELVVGELSAFMAGRTAAFDVIVIADTLIYFGNLNPVFRAASTALAPGGTLAFTVEHLDEGSPGPGYHLGVHGRYSHQTSYVEKALDGGGFRILRLDRAVLRREHNADVQSLVVLARSGAAE